MMIIFAISVNRKKNLNIFRYYWTNCKKKTIILLVKKKVRNEKGRTKRKMKMAMEQCENCGEESICDTHAGFRLCEDCEEIAGSFNAGLSMGKTLEEL